MKSLIILAEEKLLPDHQFMDIETLNWIKENPSKGYNSKGELPTITSELIELITLYSPEPSWFLNKNSIDTIHGTRHILRCMTHVILLCKRLGLNKAIMLETLIATSLHDLRRFNDKGDENHGKRASEWFRDNFPIIESKWLVLKDLNKKNISEIIEHHEVPYLPFEQSPSITLNGIDVLKTADALDRFRQPKLKWRIDEKYLKLHPIQSEMNFAYKFVIESESEYLLSKNNSFLSIINTLNRYV